MTVVDEFRRVGFVGLGAMGSRVAIRLLEAGYRMAALERRPGASAAIIARGGESRPTAREVAAASDLIFTCVTDDAAVQDVYLNSGGLLDGRAGGEGGGGVEGVEGKVFVDLSTVSPEVSQRLAAACRAAGAGFLDCPMSGSTPVAEAGELVLLVGGEEALLERVRPVLSVFSKAQHHMGENGTGTMMKLVINLILGVEMQAIAEGIALGAKAGLRVPRIAEVLAQTAVIAPAHKGKLGNAALDEFKPMFAAAMMNKDYRLIAQLAEKAGVRLPATSMAQQVSNLACITSPKEDFSVVVRTMLGVGGKR